MKTLLMRKRAGEPGVGGVVGIAVGLIIFATLGIVALQILATASTTGFSTSVATIAVTVVSILAAISVALTFYHRRGL